MKYSDRFLIKNLKNLTNLKCILNKKKILKSLKKNSNLKKINKIKWIKSNKTQFNLCLISKRRRGINTDSNLSRLATRNEYFKGNLVNFLSADW